MKQSEASSAFLKKGAPKTFAKFTRDAATSPGPDLKKVFAELFSKSDRFLSFQPRSPA
jgi:hypothetical protein